MPVVTDIKRQKRVGSTRFNIFVDDVFAFTMSDLDLSMSGVRVGLELSQEDVNNFSQAAKEAKAYALALRYLAIRLRSRREILDYLKRKECDAEDIETALERLEKLGLVDDVKFARAWIADRMAVRPRSRMRLGQELTAKGVSREDISAALEDLEPEREIETLKALITRKKRSGYSDEKRLQAYLQRQGYRWSLINEALKEINAED